MKNEHWLCDQRHTGVGVKTGDHGAKWGCAVNDKHDPRGGPRDCSVCKTAYADRYNPPNRRQYAPTYHYDCDLAPWEHAGGSRVGALGGHRDGCKTKEGHEGGAGQKCYACRMMYLGRKDDDPFLGKMWNHPHYACKLTPAEHPVAKTVGRGHRAGCDVAKGHDAGIGAKGCKACALDRDDAGKMRSSQLMRTYGITTATYDEMLATQGGGCAICKKTNADGRRLAIDHHHGTGKVRGLLCHNCNVAIGGFFDDAALMRAAAGYVESRA